MTRKEQIKAVLETGLFNIAKVEERAGIRRLKMYEYLRGVSLLTPEQEKNVLNIINTAHKLK
jgi:hypothetical protein